MKKFPVIGGILAIIACSLTGCGPQNRGGLLTDASGIIDLAAIRISDIDKNVNDAAKRAEKANAPPDFSDALANADSLMKIADEASELTLKIKKLGKNFTEEDRKFFAKTAKADLDKADAEFLKQKNVLRATSAKAEKLNPQAAASVSALREKIRVIEEVDPFKELSQTVRMAIEK